nr:protein FAR1-RELATED SEQUENCE 3-like isoform X2 [Ipomoea trifida]
MNGPKVFFVRVGPLAIELLPYGSGLTTTWTSSSMRPSLEFTCTTDCQKSGPTGQRPSTLSITKFEPKFTFMTFIIFNDILFVLHNAPPHTRTAGQPRTARQPHLLHCNKCLGFSPATDLSASSSPRRHRPPATSFPVSVFTLNPPQSPAVSPFCLHQLVYTCLKSMTWMIERKNPTNKVAGINLKLQDYGKSPAGETEVQF